MSNTSVMASITTDASTDGASSPLRDIIYVRDRVEFIEIDQILSSTFR